ncbi:phosphate-starvation-inducible PsiE family protein [Methanoculleus sp.]|uniref:phosphate-starvation-inducible PsiE family protein n=1 Tax=Methanoculleus sp. TaxID=90427 RepID=UPI0025FD2308|nr:phosphate-starvation-inducible PsiE family protein [Methanoculleus sp.]
MRRFVERFEHFTYIVLIIFLIVLLSFTLLELGWLVVGGLIDESTFRLDSQDLFDLLGYFLLVLIGLELLETIKAYLDRREFHVEIIILVAIIAIARKVILLGTAPVEELVGIALIIIALCGGYYLVRRAGMPHSPLPDDGVPSPAGREEP